MKPVILNETVDWRGHRIVPGDTIVYGKSALGYPVEAVVEKIEHWPAGSTYGGWTRDYEYVLLTVINTKTEFAFTKPGERVLVTTGSVVWVPKLN